MIISKDGLKKITLEILKKLVYTINRKNFIYLEGYENLGLVSFSSEPKNNFQELRECV